MLAADLHSRLPRMCYYRCGQLADSFVENCFGSHFFKWPTSKWLTSWDGILINGHL